MGLLWFWATDPASGPALHSEMAQLGLCEDEYADSDPPYFPYQLYVREARRLVGDFVWTEHKLSPAFQARSVGLGAYSFDCHWVSLFAVPGNPPFVAGEGRVNNDADGKPSHTVYMTPYRVPYDAFLPRRHELANVLVPVACSASHVRINAVRMEPAWMIQGHAAGSAAALALQGSLAVADVNVTQLQSLLVTQGQKIEP